MLKPKAIKRNIIIAWIYDVGTNTTIIINYKYVQDAKWLITAVENVRKDIGIYIIDISAQIYVDCRV